MSVQAHRAKLELVRRAGQRFAQRSLVEQCDILVVLVLSTAAEIAVRSVRLKTAAHLFGLSLAYSSEAQEVISTRELPAWAIQRLRTVELVMRRWPVDGVCLRQSLITGQRLRRLDPSLRLGVARVDGRISAHAWIEIDGRSLDPSWSNYLTLGRHA